MKLTKLLLLLVLALVPLKPLLAIDNELNCLAKNIYYEARGEPTKGKLAVALVTLNRVKDKRYPKSICAVVYQKNQFSWTRSYSSIKNAKQWANAKELALVAYMNRDILGNFTATHFHAKYVNPRWKLKKIATIGQHVFYA